MMLLKFFQANCDQVSSPAYDRSLYAKSTSGPDISQGKHTEMNPAFTILQNMFSIESKYLSVYTVNTFNDSKIC